MLKILKKAIWPIVLIFSFLLAACGANATPTPEPTALPDNYTGIKADGFGFHWEGPGDPVVQDNYIVYTSDKFVVYINSYILNNAVDEFGENAVIYVYADQTDSNGRYLGKTTCQSDDNKIVNNGEETFVNIYENGPYQVTCSLPSGDVIIGTTEFWKIASIVQTLTAAPSATPTVTPTRRVISPDQIMQTLTAYAAQTMTAAPTITGTPPTAIATPRGDKCPVVDPKEWAATLHLDYPKQKLTIFATTCVLTKVGGEKVYGEYVGTAIFPNRDAWKWTFSLDENGVAPGLAIPEKFIVNKDRCWFDEPKGGFIYIQCDHAKPPTATSTPRPTSTPSATATPH